MALAGSFICSISGVDSLGGLEWSIDAIIEGLGYATIPIMALLFILDVCLLTSLRAKAIYYPLFLC